VAALLRTPIHSGLARQRKPQAGSNHFNHSKIMKPLPVAPFVSHAGIVAQTMDADGAVSVVELEPHHLNRLDSAHGGLIATLLDNAMVNAARAVSGPDARLATIEMKINFMRAGKGSLRCTARCRHSTAKLAFCDADVHDASGKLVATASSTLQYMVGSGRKS
jgi:uncharacterized protein (TIGR00369 family)